ncbi:uncharacterized protein LOC143300806 [Babylonia areolata]|uniref:uncharacterized protein LOC143300806 n=1 Tax=Babylonia areolata TaxID=304850 RepID=UPI003FD0F6E1
MSELEKSSFSLNSSLSEMSTASVLDNSSETSVPEGCVTTDFFEFIPWDNEDNIVDKEVDNIVNLIFSGIFLPPMFIVSFITNVISMIVFYKQGIKERINACLFSLSLMDLLSISVTTGFNSEVVYMFIVGKAGQLGPSAQFYIRYNFVGLYGLVTSAQIVYSVIALERCLCITRPLIVKHFMSTKTTVISLWTVTIVITGSFFYIAGVRYGVLCVFNPGDGSIAYVSYPADLYFRYQFVWDFMYITVYGVFFPAFSFVCVTVCTVVTAIKLKKLSEWRETVSSASTSVTSRDVAITRVIVSTSVLFIICILPGVIMRSVFLFVPELKFGGRNDNLAWLMRRFYFLERHLLRPFLMTTIAWSLSESQEAFLEWRLRLHSSAEWS